MSTIQRRNLLLHLLSDAGASSQQELVVALAEQGFAVTQATVSRDLASIGAIKSKHGYALPNALRLESTPPVSLERALRDHTLSAVPADSIIVLKTTPAHAAIVADAFDSDPPEGVVGTIAGENTVFVATLSKGSSTKLADRFTSILTGDGRNS